MTKVLEEVLAANAAYVSGFGNKGKLAIPPARKFAILTCMDARIDPACLAGSECRVDADCGSGGYCSPSMGPYSGSCGIAYFCHTAVDTCLDDSDCDGGMCRYDTTAGHWACADGDGCVPPP